MLVHKFGSSTDRSICSILSLGLFGFDRECDVAIVMLGYEIAFMFNLYAIRWGPAIRCASTLFFNEYSFYKNI